MLKALDSNNEIVYIDEATPNEKYFCQICNQLLMQRRGQIKAHHFAHYSPSGKHADYVPCSDKWHYDVSKWCIEWKKRFERRYIEKVIQRGYEKHLADVLIGNVIVIFQQNSISIEEFNERNKFFIETGHMIVWVFDLTEEFKNKRIVFYEQRNKRYEWSYVKKLFKKIDLSNDNVTIYIQTSEDDNKVLERVTSSLFEFNWFYTDKDNAFTINDFVKCINTFEGKKVTITQQQKTQLINKEINNSQVQMHNEELAKKVEEMRKKQQEEYERRSTFELELKQRNNYAGLFPNYVEDGRKLTDIISSNFKDFRVIRNICNNEYYYFKFGKGMAFYDKIISINKYNIETREIGIILTNEERKLLSWISYKEIWEIVYL